MCPPKRDWSRGQEREWPLAALLPAGREAAPARGAGGEQSHLPRGGKASKVCLRSFKAIIPQATSAGGGLALGQGANAVCATARLSRLHGHPGSAGALRRGRTGATNARWGWSWPWDVEQMRFAQLPGCPGFTAAPDPRAHWDRGAHKCKVRSGVGHGARDRGDLCVCPVAPGFTAI